MKKLFYLAVIVLFTSCTKEPIERYCGGIIVHKASTFGGSYIKVKYDGRFSPRVYLYSIDYQKYEVGDTIKCTASDSLLYSK